MRRNRFKWRVVLLLILGVFSVVGSGPASAHAEGERLVLAFYYNWFDENSWGPNKVPDQPAPTYVSRDRAVMARHIDQAKGAGIDALVVSWYGPREQDNQTETNLRAMLDEAAARGFRLGVDFEVTSPFYRNAGDVQAGLKALIATHAQHPAYLRWNGKPVIFFWRQQRFNTATWAAIRAAVDPNHDTIWIEEGVDVAPLSVFDGHHLYSVTWNPPTDMAYTANKFANTCARSRRGRGVPKVYVATVMPGYNDRKTGRGNAFAVGREDGAYYARSWQAAIGSAPDWVVITSFNEFPEGTYIEPSQAYGNLFLDLTAQWSAAFRGSAPPPPPTAAKPKVAAPAKPKPKPAVVKPTSTPKPTPMRTRTPEPVFTLPGGLSGK